MLKLLLGLYLVIFCCFAVCGLIVLMLYAVMSESLALLLTAIMLLPLVLVLFTFLDPHIDKWLE